jgi:AcrR family transcriptional regulator
MTTKPTAKVRKAFDLLRKHGDKLSIKEIAEKAGCSRSAIYRSALYQEYIDRKEKRND